MSLEQYYEKMKSEKEENKKKYLEEHNLRDFYQWKKGDNSLHFFKEEPKEITGGKYGNTQCLFHAKNNDGREVEVALNKKNPIVLEILEKINKNELDIKINKSGEGIKTRYELI